MSAASQVADAIKANVEDVDAGRITWSEFGERQRKAWDSVARGELNIIGSACYRRHLAVHRALKARSAS